MGGTRRCSDSGRREAEGTRPFGRCRRPPCLGGGTTLPPATRMGDRDGDHHDLRSLQWCEVPGKHSRKRDSRSTRMRERIESSRTLASGHVPIAGRSSHLESSAERGTGPGSRSGEGDGARRMVTGLTDHLLRGPAGRRCRREPDLCSAGRSHKIRAVRTPRLARAAACRRSRQ